MIPECENMFSLMDTNGWNSVGACLSQGLGGTDIVSIIVIGLFGFIAFKTGLRFDVSLMLGTALSFFLWDLTKSPIMNLLFVAGLIVSIGLVVLGLIRSLAKT